MRLLLIACVVFTTSCAELSKQTKYYFIDSDRKVEVKHCFESVSEVIIDYGSKWKIAHYTREEHPNLKCVKEVSSKVKKKESKRGR